MADKRVVKTNAIIVDTFIDLMGELGINKITVKKLCEVANISRKTFYTHFETMDTLLEYIVCSRLPVATGGFYSSAIALYREVGECQEFYDRYLDIERAFQMEIRNNEALLDIFLKRKNYEVFIGIIEKHVKKSFEHLIDQSSRNISEPCVDLQLQITMHSAFLTTEWSLKNRNQPADYVANNLHYALSTSFIDFVNLLYS